jgi:UDP-arabinose 4-epimerase
MRVFDTGAQRVGADEVAHEDLQGKHVVVTGGAGYIGSHAVLELLSRGSFVTIIDNLARGHRSTLQALQQIEGSAERLRIVELDITKEKDLFELFNTEGTANPYGPIAMVWHFAAYTYVGESISEPELYERNNVDGTKALLAAMDKANIATILFSSSCSIYGDAAGAVNEETSPHPLSPYAESKVHDETLIRQWVESSSQRTGLVFRLFNVVGADLEGRIGEHLHTVSNEISTRISQVCFAAALNEIPNVMVHGTNYDTRDGTAMRDYVHVTDVVQAFILGARGIPTESGGSVPATGHKTYNVGSGNGYTVREFFDLCKGVTGSDFSIEEDGSEEGGSPGLYADISKISDELGWEPTSSSDLSQMLTTAWTYARDNQGNDVGLALSHLALDVGPALSHEVRYELEEDVPRSLKLVASTSNTDDGCDELVTPPPDAVLQNIRELLRDYTSDDILTFTMSTKKMIDNGMFANFLALASHASNGMPTLVVALDNSAFQSCVAKSGEYEWLHCQYAQGWLETSLEYDNDFGSLSYKKVIWARPSMLNSILKMQEFQLAGVVSIDLDIAIYEDLLQPFRQELQNQADQDVYLVCGIQENAGCNGGLIMYTKKATPLSDAWLASSRTPDVCSSKVADQAGLASIADEYKDKIFFLPHGVEADCGHKTPQARFTHYNCKDPDGLDKIGRMKANGDWLVS